MAERRDACRYCGEVAHGWGCSYSPNNMHVESGDEDHCIYCGSTDYGYGCSYGAAINNGYAVHRHGPGSKKCVWCGMPLNTGLCSYSPTGKHEA